MGHMHPGLHHTQLSKENVINNLFITKIVCIKSINSFGGPTAIVLAKVFLKSDVRVYDLVKTKGC